MKLELIRRSERSDYVCYGTKMESKYSAQIWKIYLPRMAMRYNTPERMVVFCAMESLDPNEHICHTCQRHYPKHQYAKHAKRYHK
jgi:hypothetical protein